MSVTDIGSIALSAEEICELTRYKLPVYQMRVLKELGIKAKLLHDNTVRVLRRDLLTPEGQAGLDLANEPQLKF